jgi:glycerate kinase
MRQLIISEQFKGNNVMSEASGLWRVAADERCVERQSTYGTGEMLTHALRCGEADRAVIGLGGSATNDGGMGLAAALGFRFLDGGGLELEPVPANLPRLERVTPRISPGYAAGWWRRWTPSIRY